jgi:hypothetical protein
MNTFLKLTAAAAAFAGLTACDALGLGGEKSAGGNGASNSVAANTATADANGAASVGGKDPAAGGNAVTPAAAFTGAVTREFLIGRWTDTNDCNTTVEFLADSTFTVPGGGHGIWALDGDRLTFQGGSGSRSARVQAIDTNTITLLQDDGSLGRSTRCTN